MTKLRVGIISANWGVHAHLPAWRSLGDVEVVGICTSRRSTAEAAASANGIPLAFDDYEAMAEHPDIDLIDCGTRPPLREKMVLAALAGGKHVYQGMPFATSLRAARSLYAALETSGRAGAVDAFIQATPAIAYLRRLLDEGVTGGLHGMRLTFDLPLFFASGVAAPGYAWFADPANGCSAPRNFGGHALHALVHLFGPIAAVAGTQSQTVRNWGMPDGTTIEPQVPDTAHLVLRFASGLEGTVGIGWSVPSGEGFRLDVWGGDARLVASSPGFPQAFNTRLSLMRPGAIGAPDGEELVIPNAFKSVAGSTADAAEPRIGLFPMAAAFRSLVDAARGHGKATPSFAQAVHVEAVVDAFERAAAEGRWISVAP